MSEDKQSAYETLYHCLHTVAKLTAPFAPFYADQLYQDLTGETKSVHLTRFPEAKEEEIDQSLETSMAYAQQISSMVLALRRRMNIKVRQPLAKFLILTNDPDTQTSIKRVEELILNEVNVKQLIFADNSADVVVKRIKPNFKALGPIFGKDMKQVANFLTQLSKEEIRQLEQNGKIEYLGKDILLDHLEIISEDVPGWLVQNDGAITVALDETITTELRLEGLARELVNRIQNIRKAQDFQVSDKINVVLEEQKEIDQVLQVHKAYISTQVQAISITTSPVVENGEQLNIDEDIDISVLVTKA